MTPTLAEVAQASVNEAGCAQSKYGDFASAHEALGVLIEEVDELKTAIHANKLGSVYLEAIQVAAVALRLAWHCEWSDAFKRRSTGAF